MPSLKLLPKPARQITAADGLKSWGWRASAARLRGRLGSGHAELPCDRVHRLCKLDIERGDAAGIMGRQNHFHRFVRHLRHSGLVIVLFSHQRDADMNPNASVEILENKGFAQSPRGRACRSSQAMPSGRSSRFRRQPSADERLPYHQFYLTPNGPPGILPQLGGQAAKAAGNHDGDVTRP